MSAALAELPLDVVVPDGVEAIEQYRVWDWNGTSLVSKNGEVWKPGEALQATCKGGSAGQFEWDIVRHGLSLEAAQAHAKSHNDFQSSYYMPSGRSYYYHHGSYIPIPSVEPAEGYGYSLRRIEHDAPHENCTCGIYAAQDTKHGYSGDVWGKVKLWGKIVPGETGARAEFAYPSELHVPASLANDPGILGYGVPVIAESATQVAAQTIKRRFTPLRVAIAVNLGACALNLSIVVLHVV